VCVIANAIARDGFFIIVALVGAWRAFEKKITRTHDWNAFATFASLFVVMAAVILAST
jgi:hypothetical protein